MSFIDIDTFKSKIKDLARPNRFKVFILGLDNIGISVKDNFSFLVKSINLPSFSQNVIEIHKFGMNIPILGDRNYNEITLNFLNDKEYYSRKIIEQWFEKIQKYDDTRKIQYSDYSKATIEIYQLDNKGNNTIGYKIINPVPINITDIQFDMDSTDSIEIFSTTFKFLRYEHI